jgi:gliding motility-associated-like protein
MFRFYLLLTIFLFFIGIFPINGQQGQWTWMKGDSIFNSTGHYGIKGLADPENCPPALAGANGWVDQQGIFWMYGGIQNHNMYCDLWKYDVSVNMWTWVNGPGLPNEIAVYGTIGIPTDSTSPGSRAGFTTWTDYQGNLWLFGGSDNSVDKNDLWRYQIANNQWTWMKGSSYNLIVEHYGTITVPASENNPPCRISAYGGWVDTNGDLWMFGGISPWGLNDVWKYDINTNNWTWMAGSDSIEVAPEYGTINVPSSNNTPGSRAAYAHWCDSEGMFWLFGGSSGVTGNLYNDLWQFNPDLLQWTWVGGPNFPYSPGSCEQCLCNPSTNNLPSARSMTSCWKGFCDYFFLYGGFGAFGIPKSDMWCYDKLTQKWTFTKGSLLLGSQGHHGILGIPDPVNQPRGFDGSCSWTDLNGNFWFFGGRDSLGLFDEYYLNELWKYTPDTLCPSGQMLSNLSITPDTTICYGDTIMIIVSGGTHYEWYPKNNISDPYIPNPLIYPDSTTVYRVQIQIDECVTELFVCIHVNNDTSFSLSPQDTTICKGDSIQLYTLGGDSILWQPANYLSNSTIHNPIAFPDTTITYTVSLANSCFTKTFSVQISVLPGTVKEIVTPDTLVCSGQVVTVKAIGGIHYLWSNGLIGDSITVSTQQPAVFSVTITDQFGCMKRDTIVIDVNSIPELNLSVSDTMICEGTSVNLIASGANFYKWYLNNMLLDSINTAITSTPTQSSIYSVIGSNNNNCNDSASVLIETINCDVIIPNVFTPNGDGINDDFQVKYDGPADILAQIFNRWGVKLFEGHNIKDHWDGKYHEMEVSVGTYYYVIWVGNDEYTGVITLLR